MNNGVFCISLDFEKYWGMRDKIEIHEYEDNILEVDKVIDELLKIFNENSIHATWATVGFLFFENKKELLKNIKKFKSPDYVNSKLNPYNYIYENDLDPRIHFSLKEIKKIKKTKYQEIATHTFSHYYCLEDGQNLKNFNYDLSRAINVSVSKINNEIYSIVFPRNQVNISYLETISKKGLLCFRSNPDSYLYKERNSLKENNIIRLLRLIDSYINISGFHGYDIEKNIFNSKFLINVRASMFLRPFNNKLRLIEKLKILRIKNAMTNAAKKNKMFHLWWHPHNFGKNKAENFKNLEIIIDHFKYLENQYEMKSMNMEEIALMKLNNSNGKI